MKKSLKQLLVILILAILLLVSGLFYNNYALFIFGLICFVLCAYLSGIQWKKKEDGSIVEDIKNWEENWEDGVSGIIRGFLLILILLNIGRLGTVLIYETSNSINPELKSQTTETFNIKINNSNINLTKNIFDNSMNNSYSVNYTGINKDKLKVNLVNDYLFFKASNSLVIGNFAIEQNIPINRSYIEPFNQLDLPSDNIDIINIFTSEINKKYTSAFVNINLGFVRTAIARILFLVILINIFSIVPLLIKSQKGIEYLFNWYDIPGNDSGRFIEFLKQRYSIDWVKIAEIEKIDDGRKIRVIHEENFLYLKLNNEKTKVNVEIGCRITEELNAKTENGRLNIYEKDKEGDKEEDNTKKDFFADLILTALLLAIILTLTPEGDIGAIKLNLSLEGAISILLIIISFILVYLFKKINIDEWFKKKQ